MSEKTGKVPALLLTLGGAPLEWHIVGTDAYVHPTIASPVGGPGECPLGRAKELAGQKGTQVKLVEVTEKQAEQARADRQAATRAGIAGAREARAQNKKATAEEAERVKDEVATATSKGA